MYSLTGKVFLHLILDWVLYIFVVPAASEAKIFFDIFYFMLLDIF